MNRKTGVLLLNLGTPDSPKTGDVRKYLREFLMDERVIDIPAIKRWMLINLIIAPLRAPKSAAEYEKLWTEEGSPLLVNGLALKKKVQDALGKDYVVSFGMRYQSPSIESSLEIFKNKGFSKIIVIPLYPQYASASTGSTIQKVNEIVNTWQVIPNIEFVSSFADNKDFIHAFAELGSEHLAKEEYDHVLFSYHGLPERQIYKSSCDNYCKIQDSCCSTYHRKNEFCYRAQCFETTRLIADELKLEEGNFSNCFQSRLGKTPWIPTYIDDEIDALLKAGKKRILVYSPAFVSDCLETTVEIGEAYQEIFLEKGGERWQLVESLNARDEWVDCLVNLIERRRGSLTLI